MFGSQLLLVLAVSTTTVLGESYSGKTSKSILIKNSVEFGASCNFTVSTPTKIPTFTVIAPNLLCNFVPTSGTTGKITFSGCDSFLPMEYPEYAPPKPANPFQTKVWWAPINDTHGIYAIGDNITIDMPPSWGAPFSGSGAVKIVNIAQFSPGPSGQPFKC